MDAELEKVWSELEPRLSRLNDRERKVILYRFGLEGRDPMTLQQLGNRLRVTRERIRQIQFKAMRKLRRGWDGLSISEFLDSSD